jgi:multidrug efflux pump
MSQLLTLYTTPVVYLFLDRLRLRMLGKERDSLPSANGSLPEESA